MTSLLIDLQALFAGLAGLSASLMMLVMVLDGQRPYGAARGVWKAAWALTYITAGITLLLFAVWVWERLA